MAVVYVASKKVDMSDEDRIVRCGGCGYPVEMLSRLYDWGGDDAAPILRSRKDVTILYHVTTYFTGSPFQELNVLPVIVRCILCIYIIKSISL